MLPFNGHGTRQVRRGFGPRRNSVRELRAGRPWEAHPRPNALLWTFTTLFRRWAHNWRTRRLLRQAMHLHERLGVPLHKDLGVSKADLRREARKTFWRD